MAKQFDIDIALKGKDQGGVGLLRGFNQELRAAKAESKSYKPLLKFIDGDPERQLKSLMGLVGGINAELAVGLAGAIGHAMEKAAELVGEFREGKKSAAEIADGIVRAIPGVGDIYAGARAIRAQFDGSADAIKRMRDELDKMNQDNARSGKVLEGLKGIEKVEEMLTPEPDTEAGKARKAAYDKEKAINAELDKAALDANLEKNENAKQNMLDRIAHDREMARQQREKSVREAGQKEIFDDLRQREETAEKIKKIDEEYQKQQEQWWKEYDERKQAEKEAFEKQRDEEEAAAGLGGASGAGGGGRRSSFVSVSNRYGGAAEQARAQNDLLAESRKQTGQLAKIAEGINKMSTSTSTPIVLQ